MRRTITQRELRNDSGKVMRGLDRGDTFVVTRNGVPVGELVPLKQRQFVPADDVLEAFRAAPHIDADRFRRDIDASVEQSPKPRA